MIHLQLTDAQDVIFQLRNIKYLCDNLGDVIILELNASFSCHTNVTPMLELSPSFTDL